MNFKHIFASTLFLISVSTVTAEEVNPYYFDLLTLEQQSDLASNFINNKIRDLGGLERVKEAQKAGHDEASMVMGYIYLEGHVFEKDIDRAIDILGNAANKGGFSAFLLGKHYLDLSKEFNYSVAIKKEGAYLIEHAALNGIAEAEFLAGMMFISGDYLPEDRDMGMMHIKSAAYKGHSPSRSFLSDIDRLYYQKDQDYDKIQKHASEGNVEAIIELALLYKEGWKVARNVEKSKRLLSLAKSKGSERAGQLLQNFK